LRRANNPLLNFSQIYSFGKSTKNQRIEAWWNILTEGQTQEWKVYFSELENEGLFSGSDLDKSCLLFIYMEIIRSHIHRFVEIHNNHSIRHQRKRDHYLPTGQPYVMYFYPETGKDYKESVDQEVLTALENEVADYDLDQYLPSDTLHLYGCFLEDAGYPKEFSYDNKQHKEAYVYLRERVWQFVQEGGEIELFNSPSGAAEWIEAHRDHEIEQHRSHVNGDLQMELGNSDNEDNNNEDNNFSDNNIPDNNIPDNNKDKNNSNNLTTSTHILSEILSDNEEDIGLDGFLLNI